jgi:hypothetical protein
MLCFLQYMYGAKTVGKVFAYRITLRLSSVRYGTFVSKQVSIKYVYRRRWFMITYVLSRFEREIETSVFCVVYSDP